MSICRWRRKLRDSIDDLSQEKFSDGAPKFTVGGDKFLAHMCACYVGVVGFAFSAVWVAAPAMVQKMGISSGVGQMILSTMSLPWSLKPLYAILSDGVPIFHYKKKWYMLGWTVLGAASAVGLAFLPYSVLSRHSASLALLLLLIFMICVSLDDSLTQGMYTQVAKAKGSSIIVFKSGVQTAAGFIVALYGGFLNDMGSTGPQFLIMTTLPWLLFAAVVFLLNYMGDERQKDACKPDLALAKDHSRLFFVALALSGTTIFNAVFGLLAAEWVLTRVVLTNIAVLSLLCTMFSATDSRIAKINVYLYLCRVCTFGLQFPLQQFYTTDPRSCPRSESGELMNLPNFPFLIFNTVGGICSNGSTLLALWLFEKYISRWNARPAFWVTTVFQVIAGLFDIMNTTRYNQKLLAWTGLGDVKWHYHTVDDDRNPVTRIIRLDDLCTYLLGTAMVEPLIREIDSLPSTLLLSKLCPKGIETTMFAVLVGFFNLGLSISGQVGGLVTEAFGFNFASNPAFSEGEGTSQQSKLICDMGGDGQVDGCHGLCRTLLVGNLLLPFLTIPLTWVLIPNKRLDEDFLDEADEEESGELQLAAATAAEGEDDVRGLPRAHEFEGGSLDLTAISPTLRASVAYPIFVAPDTHDWVAAGCAAEESSGDGSSDEEDSSAVTSGSSGGLAAILSPAIL